MKSNIRGVILSEEPKRHRRLIPGDGVQRRRRIETICTREAPLTAGRCRGRTCSLRSGLDVVWQTVETTVWSFWRKKSGTATSSCPPHLFLASVLLRQPLLIHALTFDGQGACQPHTLYSPWCEIANLVMDTFWRNCIPRFRRGSYGYPRLDSHASLKVLTQRMQDLMVYKYQWVLIQMAKMEV